MRFVYRTSSHPLAQSLPSRTSLSFRTLPFSDAHCALFALVRRLKSFYLVINTLSTASIITVAYAHGLQAAPYRRTLIHSR